MIVYIAGKMTGLPDMGHKLFREAEKDITQAGHIALNPATIPAGMPKSKYLPICLAMIDAADAVLALPNCWDSPGAKVEISYAKYQGKEIFYTGKDKE